MMTKGIGRAYESQPAEVREVLLALSVLLQRIGALSRADRDDLFELLQELRKATDAEEREAIRLALEEILAQLPAKATPLDVENARPMSKASAGWAEHVGRKIREFREKQGLTQAQLAEKAGLPQSHISRLENAEHTATSKTLEKIAVALGITTGDMDPCVD